MSMSHGMSVIRYTMCMGHSMCMTLTTTCRSSCYRSVCFRIKYSNISSNFTNLFKSDICIIMSMSRYLIYSKSSTTSISRTRSTSTTTTRSGRRSRTRSSVTITSRTTSYTTITSSTTYSISTRYS